MSKSRPPSPPPHRTDHQDLLERLRKSEERYRLLSRATHDVTWDWDLEKAEVVWGAKLGDRLGYVGHEAAEPSATAIEWWEEKIHPEERDLVTRSVTDAVSSGETTWTAEYRFRKADGTYAVILDRAFILRNENGRAVRMLGAMEDITGRKEAQDALARSNTQLEQFAYAVSHDLKEPLRKIRAFGDLLKDHAGDLPPKLLDFVSRMQNAAERMSELIDGLLQFSRAGRNQDPNEPVALPALVQNVIADLPLPGDATLTVEELPTVPGNRAFLEKLFQNLIANAAKFRREEPVRIEIRAERQSDQWVFSVKDNGIGIEQAFQERIFNVFQRLHPRGTYPGAGIGLATCKRIVEQHGGKIWVTSAPQKGATFFFSLPAA